MMNTNNNSQSVTSEGYIMGGINFAVYKVEIIPSEIRLPDAVRRALPSVRSAEECLVLQLCNEPDERGLTKIK